MSWPVFRQALKENRRSLFWWTVGTAGFIVFAMAFYPSIKDQPALNQLYASEALQAFVGTGDITSPVGYMTREVFSLSGPLVLMIYGIITGTALLAGEEGRKTLPLLLANPVSRTGVLLGKFATLKALLLTVSLGMLAVICLFGPLFELSFPFGHLISAFAMMFLLGLGFGSIGFLIGTATGKRGLAGGITGAVGFAMYLLNTLQTFIEPLQPYRFASLFYYYDPENAVIDYPKLLDVAVLVGVSVVCLGAAIMIFRHRDLNT